MNKSELIGTLATKEGLTVKVAETVVDTFFKNIAEGLANGGRAEIRGFASFKVKEYQPYAGRNPKTGEAIAVKPKKMPFFRAGKELKSRVDGQEPE